jgi:hypothetical protein
LIQSIERKVKKKRGAKTCNGIKQKVTRKACFLNDELYLNKTGRHTEDQTSQARFLDDELYNYTS